MISIPITEVDADWPRCGCHGHRMRRKDPQQDDDGWWSWHCKHTFLTLYFFERNTVRINVLEPVITPESLRGRRWKGTP